MFSSSEARILLVVTLLTLYPLAAHAVDGALEINPTCAAITSGCFPGDTAGYPVTITNPGSYVLTGNLTVSSTTADAIEITADDVTVDLNGFAISGPGSGSGNGILADVFGTTVLNGTVRGFGSDGLRVFGDAVLIKQVRALDNGSDGIDAGASGSLIRDNISWNNGGAGIRGGLGSTVTNNSAQGNGSVGISVLAGSTIVGNTARANDGDGIQAFARCLVSQNTVHLNQGDGIQADFGSTVTDNTAGSNTNFGLNLDAEAGYGNNVLDANNGGNANPQVANGNELGSNVCGGDLVCP